MTMVIFSILVVMGVMTYGEGYRCYFCSYGENDGLDQRSCITSPDRQGFRGTLKCNSTSYCVIQEQYDKKKDSVTSYFRSCSGNTWGNACWQDYSHVTCRASCQGDLCNMNETGALYQTLTRGKENGHGDMYGTGARANASMRDTCIFATVAMTMLRIYRWLPF